MSLSSSLPPYSSSPNLVPFLLSSLSSSASSLLLRFPPFVSISFFFFFFYPFSLTFDLFLLVLVPPRLSCPSFCRLSSSCLFVFSFSPFLYHLCLLRLFLFSFFLFSFLFRFLFYHIFSFSDLLFFFFFCLLLYFCAKSILI